MTVLAILAATAAAALAVPARPALRPVRLPSVPVRALLPVCMLAAVLLLHGHALALALILVAAGFGTLTLVGRTRARKAADANRVRVVEACEALASELRAGQSPLAAIEHSAEVWTELAPVAAAGRYAADVPASLRRVSREPGADALVEVAAAWQVSQSVGAGLAHAVDRVAESARGRLATHRVVAAELASAQATARMVALLPVVMLLLSDGAGADPWRFLLKTTPGLCCLAGGLGLALTGMWWIDRIVARVHTGEL